MGLDVVELVMRVEEHFEIDIPDEIAGTIDSPGELKRVVGLHVGRRTHSDARSRATGAAEISEAIDAIVEDETGIERTRFHDGSHLVHELGLD